MIKYITSAFLALLIAVSLLYAQSANKETGPGKDIKVIDAISDIHKENSTGTSFTMESPPTSTMKGKVMSLLSNDSNQTNTTLSQDSAVIQSGQVIREPDIPPSNLGVLSSGPTEKKSGASKEQNKTEEKK